MILFTKSVPSFFLITCVTFVVCFADDLTITVKQGDLRGHILTTRKGREIVAFQGIPYAKPPVGELRFKISEPAEAWSGVRDASKDGPMCPQIDIIFRQNAPVEGGEDCLYLNVFTPQTNPKKPLAVMVWIHGGGWFSGSNSIDVYGPNFLLDKDIVLVTINYRLGPLGFLSTGDAVCPGNNGLKDQTLALKWVRDNIAQFGGDPKRVTLFGQSAGGASTHYHLLSPMSKGLFHGGISHSGTALNMWALTSRTLAKERANKLGSLLDCPTSSSQELVDCLRTKDAMDIVATDPLFREWGMFPIIPFPPVVETESENVFLPDEPIELLLDSKNVTDVPWITGITSSDGAIVVSMIFHNSKLLQELSDDFDRIAPISMEYGDTSPDPEYVTKRIREFYFGDQPISKDTKYSAIDMFTDAYSLFPADESVRLQATTNSAPVFYYNFDYKPPVSFTSIHGDPSEDCGVCHSDDLQFLFPHNKLFPDGKFSENDFKVVDLFTTLWTEFAQTGNPSPVGHQYAHWHPVKNSLVEYFLIDRAGETHMRTNLLAERAHFWATLPLTSHSYTNLRDEL